MPRRRIAVSRAPVVLFLATGLLALAAIVLGTAQLSSRAAEDEAVADARTTTEILARLVAEPLIPRGLVEQSPAALDKFDRAFLPRLVYPELRRVKIWAEDGTIVYSDKTQLIGDVYPLGADEIEVINADRVSDAEVSDLSRPENRFERGDDGLLEVYTRIVSPEGQPLLFEVYYSAAAIESSKEEIFSEFRPITLGALGGVVIVATGLLIALTSRLRRSAQDRERLLRTAVEASDAERVRIARDLHDGVVQDLAGASFVVSALARSEDVTPPTAAALEEAAESMRTSLRSLRSLMVEIYPPELSTESLQASLEDLLAPAVTQGIQATAHVHGVEDATEDAIALIWRVAQESVRNALRHAEADHITVEVSGVGSRIVLTVRDDGVGFDPTTRPTGHFGLRGLQSLVEEADGTLEVESAPGRGTLVRLEVARLADRARGLLGRSTP